MFALCEFEGLTVLVSFTKNGLWSRATYWTISNRLNSRCVYSVSLDLQAHSIFITWLMVQLNDVTKPVLPSPVNPLQKDWDNTAKTLRNGSKTPCIRITRFRYVFVCVFTRECYPLAKAQARLSLLDFVAWGFRWHIFQVIPVSTRNNVKHLFIKRL